MSSKHECESLRRRTLLFLPGLWMVARIDGRSFTRLTREVHRFDDRALKLVISIGLSS
jgi:tRNA(His) 5'-end guanylyltransferase